MSGTLPHDNRHLSALETEFHFQLMATYIEAKRSCRYNAAYLLQMLTEVGGVETAKRLLAGDNPAAGLPTLWECSRLDLSVEAKVLLPGLGRCLRRKRGRWHSRD